MKTGDKLAGRYEIQGLLGQGGMGEVWRAVDQTLDRPVAVKTLSARLSEEELRESLPRFQREGRAAARLNHPSIATIYDAGEQDGQLYLVLEFVNGEDLGKVLARQPGGLPVDQVLDIGAQAADGLAVAHEAGVIHRDIKPANLMLLRRGRVKILDFGIARLEGTTSGLSATGTVVGTMAYMPPEQMLGQQISGGADVYSLGATLFHLLTGRLVFPGDDLRAVIAQHLTAQPPDPRAVRPDCPLGLAGYVLAMLAKEPEGRPDAEAVADTLRAMRSAPTLSVQGPAVSAGQTMAGLGRSAPQDPAGIPYGPGAGSWPSAPAAAGDGRAPTAGWLVPHGISRYRVIQVNRAAHGSPHALAFSPSHAMLASGGQFVQLWDVHTGGLLATYEDRESMAGIGGVAFSHAGHLLAIGAMDADAILLRDVASGRVVGSLTGLGPGKDQVAFSPDDSLLAARTSRGVGVWEVATGRLIAAESVDAPGSVAFSPDGSIVAVGAANRVLLREVDPGASALRPRSRDLIVTMRDAENWGIAFSPDGGAIVAAVSGPRRVGSVYVWNLSDGRPLVRCGTTKGIVGAAFSPAGDTIASVEDLKSVKFWEAASGRLVTTVDSPATCLAFSPDGSYLAAGCTREIHIWRSGPAA